MPNKLHQENLGKQDKTVSGAAMDPTRFGFKTGKQFEINPNWMEWLKAANKQNLLSKLIGI